MTDFFLPPFCYSSPKSRKYSATVNTSILPFRSAGFVIYYSDWGGSFGHSLGLNPASELNEVDETFSESYIPGLYNEDKITYVQGLY